MRAKPRYCGSEHRVKLGDFSTELRGKLRGFFPYKEEKADPVFGHPADTFVESVLSEAWWAKAELHWQGFDGTKESLRAEQQDLLKRLTDLERRLRATSPDLDRIIGVAADPLGCADKLAELLPHIEAAGGVIEGLSRTARPDVKAHAVAVEMAIRVLRVLKENGIPPAATGDAYVGYTSNAVRILKLIGDDMRLVMSELTWRDVIIEAKSQATDLQ